MMNDKLLNGWCKHGKPGGMGCKYCDPKGYELNEKAISPKPETMPEKLARLIRENPGMELMVNYGHGLCGIETIEIEGYLPNKFIVITIGTP
jgi:hypothetical protein